MPVFGKDPDSHLQELGIEIGSFDAPDVRAVFEPAKRAFVNHDVFYFSTASEAARFRRDPLPWCPEVRDPVTGAWFEPTRRSPRIDHAERVFFFASDSTRALFAQHPDSLSIPRARMLM